MNKMKYDQLREKAGEDKLNKNKHKENDSIAPPPSNIKLNKDLKDKEGELKKEKVIKSKENSLIRVLFSMKGIDMYIPIDPSSHNTSIIFMTVEIPIKYVMKTDYEVFLNYSKILKTNYNQRFTELIINIIKGNFSIYDYKEDEILLNTINQIYDDFDFSFFMKNELDNNLKCNKHYISFQTYKDMNITININHIIVFMDLYDKIMGFYNDINSIEEIKGDKKEKEKNEFKLLVDEDDIKRTRTDEIINIKEKNKEKEKIIQYQKDNINFTRYNDIFTYEFGIGNVSIKFYDIIDGLYQSLFEFLMSNTKIEMLQNNNPKDCTNLANYLINSFSTERKELNSYDKNNFFIYFCITTNIEIKCLNNYLNQWEYFIEPFALKFYYCQFLKRMRPNIELFISDNMLNINLSLNFAKILGFTLKKFYMNKEENKKNKEGKLPLNEITTETQNYLGIELPILILENYTGVDMEIWFDNIKYEQNNDLIIKLKHNQKFKLTSNLLKKYNVKKENNNLNSTLSYKFCLDEKSLKDANINEKMIIGSNFNINYHHIEIHEINELIKISIESCSDNLLCCHILFNSLISIKNETMYKNIQLCNSDLTQKIDLKENKKESVPISWLLNNNKSINLLYNNDSKILMDNLFKIGKIGKCICFNNKDIVLIDVIRYKINLEEYYYNKNIIEGKDVYRLDIILSSPIYLINNTPYPFLVYDSDKIGTNKSLNIYHNNSKLLSEYIKIINEKEKKNKNSEKQIIIKILKDINLQILYGNMLLTVNSFVDEKSKNDDNDRYEEGKTVNNFSVYNKNLSVLFKDDKNKNFLICRLFFNNPYEFISYNNIIYKTMKAELNSFKYEIVFDYYFVNRTNINLYLNNNIVEGVPLKKEFLPILSNNYTPVSKTLLNSKVKLKGENKYWSDKFELSALGEEFTLNIKNSQVSYDTFGIKISISNIFKKSICIIIEDKYIVMNDLPFEINILEEKMKTKMNI